MKDQRKLGAVLGYVQIVLQSAIGILYVPILLNRIGQAEYGLYQIVASIISYVAILETMFSSTVLRHYSVYLANGDEKRMENLLFTARRIFRLLSVIIAAASVPVGVGVYRFYSSSFSGDEMREMLVMYGVLIANLLISVNNYIYVACITAYQRFLFLKLVSIICLVIQPAAVVCAINQYPYATVIVAVQVILNIVVSLLRYLYCQRKLHIRIKQHKDVADGLLKELTLFSVGIFLTAIADQIFWKTDQIILGRMNGSTAVAVYAVGAQLFNVYMSVSHGIGSVLLPTVIQKVNTEGIHSVDGFFRKIGRIQAMLMGLVVSGFAVFGKEFLQLWVGEGYDAAYWVALCLMLPYLIDIIQGAGLSILQAVNQYAFRAKCMFVIACINILLTILLVQRMGIVGAAVSTAISIVFGSGIIMNWFYRVKIGLDIRQFWKEIVPILLLGMVAGAVGCLIGRIYLYNAWVSFAVHVVLFAVVYCVAAYTQVMNDFERNQAASLIMRFIGRSKRKDESSV